MNGIAYFLSEFVLCVLFRHWVAQPQ